MYVLRYLQRITDIADNLTDHLEVRSLVLVSIQSFLTYLCSDRLFANFKSSCAVIDFSLTSKVLELKDDDPSLIVVLDPDQFVKDLKDLDPNRWDPLPCNVT